MYKQGHVTRISARLADMRYRQLNVFYLDLPNPHLDTEPNGQSTRTETLLVLHGFPTSSADFQGQVMDALQQHFRRVIIFDYPGVQALCT